MSVWAVTMVKDEADVIAGTLRHLAGEGVAGILVADNGSTDGTRHILDTLELGIPLVVVEDPEVAYHQSAKMTRLAAMAAVEGATWIVPFDADELWISPQDRLAAALETAEGDIVTADLHNHYATAVDPDGADPYRTMVWREPAPAPLPKVAIRWHPEAVIDQGNHGASLRGGRIAANVRLEVRHFPYRSAAQMVRKARNGAAAYAASDLPAHVGAHWRSYGELLERDGPEAIHDVFRTYFWHLSPADAGLIPDPAPYRRWET